ncbi:hypothetical protein D6C88_05518 [Aureobasidium pullulans]|nr:hypothetical protein D6C88_05518 [Aureobasidium pullulans]
MVKASLKIWSTLTILRTRSSSQSKVRRSRSSFEPCGMLRLHSDRDEHLPCAQSMHRRLKRSLPTTTCSLCQL